MARQSARESESESAGTGRRRGVISNVTRHMIGHGGGKWPGHRIISPGQAFSGDSPADGPIGSGPGRMIAPG